MAFGVRFSSGTVAAPTVSFADDIDCGLYRIAANRIGMSIAGVLVTEFGTTGPVIPSGKVITFGDGSTQSAAGNSAFDPSTILAAANIG